MNQIALVVRSEVFMPFSPILKINIGTQFWEQELRTSLVWPMAKGGRSKKEEGENSNFHILLFCIPVVSVVSLSFLEFMYLSHANCRSTSV